MINEIKHIKKKLNINYVVKNNLCVGCGICAGICPVAAIKMIEVPPGIYIAEIDYSICNHRQGCNICYNICPGHSVELINLSNNLFPNTQEDFYLGRFKECYNGYSNDFNIRYHSASGGLITQLLIFMIQNKIIDGALVTRMSKNNPLKPEAFLATNKDELMNASSSKYCPVHVSTALKEIRDKDGKFAVVGLPCHIHGFRKAEAKIKGLRNKIYMYLGLFCSSTKTFMATKYLLKNYAIPPNDIRSFKYRDEGWHGNMVIRLKNNKIYRYEFLEYYPNLRRFFVPTRCTLCIDHAAELADISFGDIYIPEYWDDKIGTTTTITRDENAQRILTLAFKEGYIDLKKVDRELIINSQCGNIHHKKYHTDVRFRIFRIFGRRCPQYDYQAPRINILKQVHYFIAAFNLYLQIFIGKRRYLWPLIYFSRKIRREQQS